MRSTIKLIVAVTMTVLCALAVLVDLKETRLLGPSCSCGGDNLNVDKKQDMSNNLPQQTSSSTGKNQNNNSNDHGGADTDSSMDKKQDMPVSNQNLLLQQQASSSIRKKRKNDPGDVSVSVIVIASGQRSSSSFLSRDVLQSMPCHISLNEILFPSKQQSGDAWEIEGKEMNLETEISQRFNNHPKDLANFILKVGKRRCREMLAKHDVSTAEKCNNHCWVNYKHFSIHMSDWQHPLLWSSLLGQTRQHGNKFAMTILERDVEERWRSTWFAKHTGDWNTKGKAEHKAKLAAANIPKADTKFKNEHDNWFRLVRTYIQSTNDVLENSGGEMFPVLDFSFADVTGRPLNVTQEIVLHDVMNA